MNFPESGIMVIKKFATRLYKDLANLRHDVLTIEIRVSEVLANLAIVHQPHRSSESDGSERLNQHATHYLVYIAMVVRGNPK